MRFSVSTCLTVALAATAIGAQAATLTLQEAIADAAPIESSIQLCYGELGYFELTDDERIRMEIASATLDNGLARFAKAHTVEAYEDVEMAYIELLVDYNTRPGPPPACDTAHVQDIERNTQAFAEKYASIKGPRDR